MDHNDRETAFREWLKKEAAESKRRQFIRKNDKPVDLKKLEVRMPWGCWFFMLAPMLFVIYMVLKAIARL